MIINYVLQIIDFGWVSLWTLDHAHFLWRKTFVRNISLFCKPTSLHCEYYKPGIFFFTHYVALLVESMLNCDRVLDPILENGFQNARDWVSFLKEIGYHFSKRLGIIPQRFFFSTYEAKPIFTFTILQKVISCNLCFCKINSTAIVT